MRIVIAVLFISLFLNSCTFLRDTLGIGPKKPKVELRQVTVESISFREIDLSLGLAVENPNSFDLKLVGLKYAAYVGEELLAQGDYDTPTMIPGAKVKDVAIPLAITPEVAMKIAQSLLMKRQRVVVDLTATATFDTPFGDISLDFEKSRDLVQ